MSITLAQLRLEARQRADMTNSTFVTDSELTSYINNSISELHDILVQSYGEDYYINDVSFTTANKAESYEIASIIPNGDFYKIRGVDAKLNNSDWFTLKPFNFNERNKNLGSTTNSGISSVKYRLLGSNIMFTPIPDDSIDVKIWYIPLAQTLVDDTDSYNDLNNYSEYVIVDVAIKMLQKEESDVSVLAHQKQALKERINSASKNRDAGSGDSVSDVHNENSSNYYGSSN